MKERKIGVIMNGVTGRMGTNQHLARSIIAIRDGGGLPLDDHTLIVPEPVLVGRNPSKLEALARAHHIAKYTTDLHTCLSDPENTIYFDAQRTDLRLESVLLAIQAGKAVYCEKPPAQNTGDALRLWGAAKNAGVKNGVVQDKLWLPGIRKLAGLIQSGTLGRILAVRGEFGYWVFDGLQQIEGCADPQHTCQRPSWNYRKEDGGGIILDMFCHWRYLIENLFGPLRALSCLAATHIDKRADEEDREYRCTAEDAAYATFMCKNGIICHFNSSWAARVRRDDLLTLQVDGTMATAVAGLRECLVQTEATTPRPVWNPDVESPIDFHADWQKVPAEARCENAFKTQWELFLRHVVGDAEFAWDLFEGAKGVQLAEKGLESWQKRCWVDIEPLSQGESCA